MNIRLTKTTIGLLAVAASPFLLYFGFWQWMVCRVYVPAGYSLLLRYKGPFPFGNVPQAKDGTLVKLNEKGQPTEVGILEAMPGPGRHFYSPLEFEREIVPDIVIEPGKIGVVVSKVGQPLTTGLLADEPGFKAIWRRVLTPGRYRMNKYAYDVKTVDVDSCVSSASRAIRRKNDVTLIPPGYVGVVTNKTDNPKAGDKQGIQDDVLQPGIYFLNPEEKQIDIVSIGYNELTLQVETMKNADGSIRLQDGTSLESRGTFSTGRKVPSPTAASNASNAPLAHDPVYQPGTGIEFPSNDGFPIHLDYTAIWGILPDQAPGVVRQFGTLKDVEIKVVMPQIGSICRLYGSKRGAVDLLVGDSREAFQTDTAEELEKVLEQKDLTLLFGLTRHIYVPNQVREPIQKSKIADELKLTRDQEQLTAKAQADLTEAEAKVVLEDARPRPRRQNSRPNLRRKGKRLPRRLKRRPKNSERRLTPRPRLSRHRSPRPSVRRTQRQSSSRTRRKQTCSANMFKPWAVPKPTTDMYSQRHFLITCKST